MIRINDIKMPPGFTEAELRKAAARRLGAAEEDIRDFGIIKKGLDARRKNGIHWVVSVYAGLAGGAVPKDAAVYDKKSYAFPYSGISADFRPVVCGSGPAGIFCALMLAGAGLRPIVIERGADVDTRIRDINAFFGKGIFSSSSNIQFGEGGAGAFSDGKLNTGTKDPRRAGVIAEYIEAGAPREIAYLSKPHIGTDRLRPVAKAMRKKLGSMGGEIRFASRMAGLDIHGGELRGVRVEGPEGGYTIKTRALALAVGNSARDTFWMLHESGVALEPKSFAVGVRIEHLQSSIDCAQYGSMADFKNLPVADYKLVHHTKNGRSAYTFCVCPGGSVIAVASEEDMVATNGMSEYARGGANCNGALLVNVNPVDYGDGPLAGIEFQRKLEKAAFRLGGGGYAAPAQTVESFLAGGPPEGFGDVRPTYLPAVRPAAVRDCLPGFVAEALEEAIPVFGDRIKGFDSGGAVITAVETRSSSPVRIPRNAGLCSNIKGVFPCGEGAGYAGGIMSAAVDGIRIAEAMAANI